MFFAFFSRTPGKRPGPPVTIIDLPSRDIGKEFCAFQSSFHSYMHLIIQQN